MTEISAIIHTRPLILVSNREEPIATTLSQKPGTFNCPLGEFDIKDLYNNEYRQVQSLANTVQDRGVNSIFLYWNHETRSKPSSPI